MQTLIEDCIPEKFRHDKDQDVTVIKWKVSKNAEEKKEFTQILEEEEVVMDEIHLNMEIFNVIMCIKLLSICCEGKSDLAELKCHAEIINLQTASQLYKSSGRNWPFKQAILNYITHVYLDSANLQLFSPSYFQDNMTPLKNVVMMACNDM